MQRSLDYPDSVDLRYARASAYEEQGRLTAALRELTTLVNARPDDPAALNALGYTLADHSRELPRARKLIERAHAAAPKNAAILDSLGWVMFRQGHNAEAEAYLRVAYAEDRGGDIAAHLGEVLWQMGRSADAEHSLVRGRRRSMPRIACSNRRGNDCTAARSHATSHRTPQPLPCRGELTCAESFCCCWVRRCWPHA
jgi:Flp pilus assembly protein TadD